MKNAKKLLGMVLSLCLVLSLLAGFTAAAAEEKNLLVGAGDWYYEVADEYKSVSLETGIELALNYEGDVSNGSYQVHAPKISVEPNTTYTLTFAYSLPTTQLQYVIDAYNANEQGAGSAVGWTKLDVTGDAFANKTVSFTTGDAVAKIRVRFVSAKVGEGSATPAVVKNISVTKVENKAINGSFEAVDGAGNVVGAAGTVVTNSESNPVFNGERMMVATKDSPVTLDLTLSEYSENADLRGYVKAVGFAADSSATLTVKTAGDAVLAEKRMNTVLDDGIWDIADAAWDCVRMSNLLFSGGMELEISVTGGGSLYADGFTFEKGDNLVKNPAFNPGGASWSVSGWGADGKNDTAVFSDLALQTDGDCPDGQNYVTLNPEAAGSSMITLKTSQWLTVVPGEKYIISCWVKGDPTRFTFEPRGADYDISRDKYVGADDKDYTTDYYSRTLLMINPKKTDEWRRISYSATIPEGVTGGRFVFILHATKGAGGTAVSFCMPTVEKVANDEVRMYRSGSGGTSLVGALSWYSLPFVNVLGEEAEPGIAYAEGVTAFNITTTPEVTSTSTAIMATYRTDADGKKQLISVTMGEKATTPSAHANYLDGTKPAYLLHTQKEDGTKDTPLYGVNYPTVSMTAAELADADEIRAFAWDDISGLKPAGNYATLTK